MTEEVLFEIEEKMSGSEIADYLGNVANKIENDERISLKSSTQSVELETSGNKEFEVKVEREGKEKSLELEIEWKDEAGGLSID